MVAVRRLHEPSDTGGERPPPRTVEGKQTRSRRRVFRRFCGFRSQLGPPLDLGRGLAVPPRSGPYWASIGPSRIRFPRISISVTATATLWLVADVAQG